MALRNICVYGAGALGGSFAAKIASSLGEDVNVSVVARGAHLQAIRDKGLTVTHVDPSVADITAKVTATNDPSELPKQDLIITGLKGHQLSDAAEGIAGLLKDGTRVVMILNGIPWWYFHADKESGHAERQLPEVDPNGKLWSLIGPERILGCVAYQGAEIVEPGKISLSGSGRYFLGEPSGAMSDDLAAISELLTRSGLTIIQSPRIRDEIWTKLRGNASHNPISALTRATMDRIFSNEDLRATALAVMLEVEAVGTALGCRFGLSAEQHLINSGNAGPIRTSMLQDLTNRKPLEILPLNGMVVSLGKLAGVPTPICSTVFALATQLDVENLRD
jgi:2-dehydropantoate 2-reductase